ncbi:MAG TPA: hypothetical protein VGN17_03965 [Bryobacteraceae bacterium]|jgi:hypothetical protein
MRLAETKNREDWRTIASLAIPAMQVRNHPLLWNGEMLPIGAMFPVENVLPRRIRQLFEQNKIGVAVESETKPKKSKTGHQAGKRK